MSINNTIQDGFMPSFLLCVGASSARPYRGRCCVGMVYVVYLQALGKRPYRLTAKG